jgi:hypothetical protein
MENDLIKDLLMVGIFAGACCVLVYEYVRRNIYDDLNNAVESLNEGFVYRTYESKSLTNSISYSE